MTTDGMLEAIPIPRPEMIVVADIIAHIVRYRRRVPMIILRYARLDFAHQIGSYVGGLGEDSSSHSSEQSDTARAETEP